jgi:hypothetical protein
MRTRTVVDSTGTEATSLDWRISVFGKFRYGLLMRNQGYIEFETLGKQCWSYL